MHQTHICRMLHMHLQVEQNSYNDEFKGESEDVLLKATKSFKTLKILVTHKNVYYTYPPKKQPHETKQHAPNQHSMKQI